MKLFFATLFVLMLSVMPVPVLHAQNYSIDWATIADGGGLSTGNVYSVSGTIGQPAAGSIPMMGGNYSLIGGFWALTVVQTEGAPLLTITLTATNTVIISWPLSASTWALQQSTNLNGANWETVSATVNTNSTMNLMVVTSPMGNRFYRLVRPE